jgi:hypothetical protein
MFDEAFGLDDCSAGKWTLGVRGTLGHSNWARVLCARGPKVYTHRVSSARGRKE